MDVPRMDNLVERLDRLERENHRLKLAGALVIAGITAMVVMGQAGPSKIAKVIEAERFILRDTSGKVRGTLGISGGNPFLALFDEEGKQHITLGRVYGHASRKIRGRLIVRGEGPNLKLYDKDERTRPTTGYDERETTRTGTVTEPAESLLVLFDRGGNVVWSAP